MVFKNNLCISHALFTPVYNLAYLKVSYCRQVILFVFFNDFLLFSIVKISGTSDYCRQNKEDDDKMIWDFGSFFFRHYLPFYIKNYLICYVGCQECFHVE